MGRRIAVVNTRASNLHSVEKALVKVGASPQVVSDPGSLLDADAAVLPGVGAFDAAMRALADQDLVDAVRQFAASGRPLLCVCLGMQILLDRSEEGVREGLGIFPGEVKRLPDGMKGQQGESLKIPHMGWNAITSPIPRPTGTRISRASKTGRTSTSCTRTTACPMTRAWWRPPPTTAWTYAPSLPRVRSSACSFTPRRVATAV